MKIGILTLRHGPSAKTSITPEVIRLLEEWGARVDVIHPEERCTSLSSIRPEHDLYVLKSETELALSYAGALHAAGAAVVNPYPAAAMLKDKIIANRRLEEAGVPVAETFVAGHPRQLAPLLEEGPIVVKPYRGSKGRGVHVVWDADELENVATDEGPVLAQRYHRPDGRDRKIYCIGGQLFGVKRIWPARTYEEKLGEPFSIDPVLRDVALRCGAAFGIDIFGVDVVISDGKPWVVDLQGFPGFKGVPDAALRLADHLYAIAERVIGGGTAAEPKAPAKVDATVGGGAVSA
jgi:ribosomal protein S6--L-glutamate ligase